MTFRAVHAQWGTVFAHLPDLGCGQSWEAVWKTRPAAPVVCDECSHPMHAKTSRNGIRFFAHAPGRPTCALGQESVNHHLLKLELVTAARDAGAHAELEAPGPGGTWRADVLATDPTGAWKTALEAQLAPITKAEITGRAERMRADGVTSIWFSDLPRPPWLGAVPSVRLTREDATKGLVVAEGLVKFEGLHWTSAPPVSVADFLRWAFTGEVIPHTPSAPLAYPLRQLPQVWTAPQYIKAEDAARPFCTCGSPRLVYRGFDGEVPAVPCDEFNSESAVFRADCRACGRKYKKPWRRTTGATQRIRRARGAH